MEVFRSSYPGDRQETPKRRMSGDTPAGLIRLPKSFEAMQVSVPPPDVKPTEITRTTNGKIDELLE